MFSKFTSNKYLTQGSALVVTLIISNFFNFLLSAVLGRVLTLDQFGVFTLFNTFAYFITIFLSSLSSILNYQTALAFGAGQFKQSADFLLKVRKIVIRIGIAATIIWIAASPWSSEFFNIHNILSFLLFSPVFSLGLLAAIYRGYLHGNFKFNSISAVVLTESGSKLLVGLIIVYLHATDFIYVVIPISYLAVLSLAWYLSQSKIKHDLTQSQETRTDKIFPWKYFWASVLAGTSAAVFLNVDVVLAKHYLSADLAGQYSILSLVGKLAFFSISLLSTFIVSVTRRDIGLQIHPLRKFYLLLAGTLVLAAGSYLVFGMLGSFFIPLLLGPKASSILIYNNIYVTATICYGLAGFISAYHIVRNQYFFSKVGIAFSVIMVWGIVLRHNGIAQINWVFFLTSLGYLFSIVCLHILTGLRENVPITKSPANLEEPTNSLNM